MPKVLKIDRHRNGICGQPFWVATVREGKENMVVIRLDDKADSKLGGVCCFALNIDMLSRGVIEFGSNSFRGDHYSDLMDEAI